MKFKVFIVFVVLLGILVSSFTIISYKESLYNYISPSNIQIRNLHKGLRLSSNGKDVRVLFPELQEQNISKILLQTTDTPQPRSFFRETQEYGKLELFGFSSSKRDESLTINLYLNEANIKKVVKSDQELSMEISIQFLFAIQEYINFQKNIREENITYSGALKKYNEFIQKFDTNPIRARYVEK